MNLFPLESPAAVLAGLVGIGAFFFYLEKATGWRLFVYFPPLAFIYLTPLILTNVGALPGKSPVYDVIGELALPTMLVLLLLNLDVGGAVATLGRGLPVMLFGAVGVVVGGAASAILVGRWLGPQAWKAYGALAGSWVGGTGNMAAVAKMFDAKDEYGLAVLADTMIYMIWLPVLLASRMLAPWFSRFTKVSPDYVRDMEAASQSYNMNSEAPGYREYLYLLAVGFGTTALSQPLAANLAAALPAQFSVGTVQILLLTTAAIGMSFTPLRRIPGSRELSMALLFIFVARTGATSQLDKVADQAVPFVLGALVWIFIHGAFCLLGAKIMRVDVGTAAIASAANIGGAASAPIVAAHHNRQLVPASILMALVGYALGNYAGYLTGIICRSLLE